MLTLPHQTSSRDLGLVDDALVLRAAAGLLAGVRDQRAGGRDRRALFEPQRGLVEKGGRGVAVDLRDRDPLFFERERHRRGSVGEVGGNGDIPPQSHDSPLAARPRRQQSSLPQRDVLRRPRRPAAPRGATTSLVTGRPAGPGSSPAAAAPARGPRYLRRRPGAWVADGRTRRRPFLRMPPVAARAGVRSCGHRAPSPRSQAGEPRSSRRAAHGTARRCGRSVGDLVTACRSSTAARPSEPDLGEAGDRAARSRPARSGALGRAARSRSRSPGRARSPRT